MVLVSRSNLITFLTLNVQIKTTFFVCSKTDKLFQKPKYQFILASSFYIENVNKYLKFYSSTLSLLKKVTVVLKFRLHFESLISQQKSGK